MRLVQLTPVQRYRLRAVLRDTRRRHENIAVVCGAWHVPALQRKVAAIEDALSCPHARLRTISR